MMASLKTRQISLLLVSIIYLREINGEINLENYCFGPPYGDDKSVKHTETLGTEALNWEGFNFKPNTKTSNFVVNVYGMKLVTEEDEHGDLITTPLTGWFHLVIYLDPPDDIDRLVVNARGWMNKYGWISGVGEFLPAIQKCIDEEGYGSNPTKIFTSWDQDVEFIPCGGVSAFDPVMSGGFVKSYGQRKFGFASDIREYHLNYRVSLTPTNFYSKITFRVYGFSGDKLYGESKSETIEFNTSIVEGAADPVPNPDYPIQCHIKFPDPDIPTVLRTSSITASSIENPTTDYACLPSEGSKSLFTGRCSQGEGEHGVGRVGRRDGSSNRPQFLPEEVDIDPEVYKNLRPYDDELLEIKGLIHRACSSDEGEHFVCPTLPARPDTKPPDHTKQTKPEFGHHKINVRPTTEVPETTVDPNATEKEVAEAKKKEVEIKRGLAYIPGINTFVWDSRVIHGVIMTFLTFFVLPVDAFTSRYFKETWKKRTIYGHNVWYFLHHFWVGISIILFMGGLGRLTKARNVVGTSLVTESVVHQIVGWASVVLFAILAITGGIRCLSRGTRAIFIALHFFLGNALYLICLSEVITSTFIPGNPTNSDNYNIEGSFKTPVILVIVRFVVDIVFHVIFSILLCWSDKKAGVTRNRLYLPPPMPVIKDSEPYDMPGTTKRTIVFAIYVFISALLTIVLCALIIVADIHIGDDKKAVVMGPMSCTHETTTSFKTEFKDCS